MTSLRALIVPALLLSGCGTYTIQLSDEHNYSSTAVLDADVITVADCPKELTLDWSGLTTDLLDHELDPSADIYQMRVVRFDNLSATEVMVAIADNNLPQQEISGNVDYQPTAGETSAPLSEFAFNGTHIDPSTEACSDVSTTFMLTAMTDMYAYGGLIFFEPTPGEKNTDVELTSDAFQLTFDADLTTNGVIEVPGGRDYLINWMDLTIDGQGNPFSLSNIDQLLLARYELSTDEMEQQFYDLQLIAAEMYTAEIGGLGEYELINATDEAGNAFEGFEGEGLWLLGLFCSTCPNPAPLYLSVIEAG
jgi:hypothetical protein